MNRELGLRILSQIMKWSDDDARKEFRWLSFMSAYKYDSYRDYLAGARFIESLATWLQQFSFEDRLVAYTFIKEKLIFFSLQEIQHLIEKFFRKLFNKIWFVRCPKDWESLPIEYGHHKKVSKSIVLNAVKHYLWG